MVEPDDDNVDEAPSGVGLLNRVNFRSLLSKSGDPYRYLKGGQNHHGNVLKRRIIK